MLLPWALFFFRLGTGHRILSTDAVTVKDTACLLPASISLALVLGVIQSCHGPSLYRCRWYGRFMQSSFILRASTVDRKYRIYYIEVFQSLIYMFCFTNV